MSGEARPRDKVTRTLIREAVHKDTSDASEGPDAPPSV